MPEPKAQLVDPQGPIDVPGINATGIITATGGFAGNVQGAATGFAATTYNLNVGIVTGTKFQGNTTGNVSGLADDTNINVGIITSTSFTGDLVGNAAGLSTTTANLNLGIVTSTSFAGNFTGLASGITGTPNVVAGIVTASQFVGNTPGLAGGISAGKNLAAGIVTATTFYGDGSGLTGAGSTAFIRQSVTAQSGTTTINLNDGNIIYLTHSNNTTIAFSNVPTATDVTIIRTITDNTITWPAAITWNGGTAPTLVGSNIRPTTSQVFNLTTADGGTTWYGYEEVKYDSSNNSMWGVGQNTYGVFNNPPNDAPSYSSPVAVPGTDWQLGKVNSLDFAQSSVDINADNELWTLGYNFGGQLGQNDTTNRSSPIQIPGTWSNGAVMSHVCAFTKTDGTLWVWGYNGDGELGVNNKTHYSSPVQIPGTTWNYAGLANKGGFCTKTDGTLWMWGKNQYGQLGQNNTTYYSSPVQIPGTTWGRPRKVSSAIGIVKTNGTLWTWGRNFSGALGQNNETNYSSPKQVPGTTWVCFRSVPENAMATKTDGTLWMWGANQSGQLGQSSPSNSDVSSPVQIPGTNWDTVNFDLTRTACFATKTDGTLWVWGSNDPGQLGQNQPNPSGVSSPIQIPGTTWTGPKSIGYNGALFYKGV